MKAKPVLTVLALMLTLMVALGASSAPALPGKTQASLAAAKGATAGVRNVDAAIAAGYAELRDAKHIACIAMPGMGAMGIHYVNGSLVKDAVLDPRRPEALVYEPQGKARRLVALEYIVFAKAWKQSAPPTLFGRKLDFTPAGNRFGLPAFWSLHAWVWKQNPAGTLTPWNPRVSCN
jgi:hypothetical protein